MITNQEAPTFECEFTLEELRVMAKFLGTSLDVLARKINNNNPDGHVGRRAAEEFALLRSALDEIRDAQEEGL